jgi:hypothetical protein
MAVALEALQRWSSDAGRVHRRLTGSLATTDALVARLAAAWTGAAAGLFVLQAASEAFASGRKLRPTQERNVVERGNL